MDKLERVLLILRERERYLMNIEQTELIQERLSELRAAIIVIVLALKPKKKEESAVSTFKRTDTDSEK